MRRGVLGKKSCHKKETQKIFLVRTCDLLFCFLYRGQKIFLMNKDPWMSAMRRGDFEAAWRVSDAVLAQRQRDGIDCSGWPRHLQFIWDGTCVDDKHVLVRCYHGLGDTLQFIRLIAPLRRRAREVSVWAQPALLELLQDVHGIDRLLPLHDAAPAIEFEVDIELMEVAHALRVTAADLPGPSPYIYVSPEQSYTIDPSLLNVGIAWRSGHWNQGRSIPADSLDRLTGMPHVRFHSLQFPYEPVPFECENMACESIRRMAQRMVHLDLVVTVDTMVAHLAGGVGLPTWLLLNANPDWRWQDQGSDTPWYPTMRLIRQRNGDWNSVLDEVRARLERQNGRATAARGTRSIGCTASSS
jgi:hypothetical protein